MFQRGDSGSEKDSEQVGVRHEDRTLLPLRGQEGARRDSALPTRESPLHCPLVPPSIGHALCPVARRLLAAGHAPLLSPYSHWLLFHVPLSEFPIAAFSPCRGAPVSPISKGVTRPMSSLEAVGLGQTLGRERVNIFGVLSSSEGIKLYILRQGQHSSTHSSV